MFKKNKKMFLKWKQLFCTLIVAALLVSGITPAFAAQQTAASAVSAAQVTDIRVLADGQEVSMEKPLEVHGYHKGTVTVQAKTQGSDQFVNIPSIWDAKLKWISGNGEIRGNGIFEIMGTGEAVFSATYGGITKQFKVVSKNVDVKSIRVNVPATWDIHDWNGLGGYYVGITKGNGPRQYSYVVEPGNASDKSLVWESLTPDVAEFMEAFGNGIVPKKAGTARFKVSSKSNPEVSQEVSVNFVYRHPLKSATPGKAEYTIEEGGFQDIVINTVPAEASEQRFNWEYSEPGIVEIQDGITTNPDSVTIPKKTTHTMTALKSGEVTVTGTPFDTTSGCAPVTFTVTVTKDGVAPGVGDLVALAKENIKRGVAYLKTQSMTKYNDEWNMFAVLRSGGEVSQQVKDQYYASVCAKLKGGFDGLKNTDAARVSITLAAMGKDLTNVDGMDLMAGFYNDQYKFKLANDTSNGPIWALIALDCQKAEIPDTAKWNRDKLIEQILKFQKKDGGFGLNIGDNVTSVDMTGMAMQALAPYNDAKHPAVQSAFNKGLEYLKSKTTAKAGYADMDGGKENSCSAAQVLTALAAAGIDPTNAENGFTKGKHNIVKNLDSFKSGDGYSLYAGGKADVMSTQQVTYAMEAYVRLMEGGNRLYDLTDVPKEVTADQRAADAVIKAIDAIGKVTLESKEAIQNARNAYDALTEIQKGLVTNLAVLEKAESELKALEEQNSGKEVIVAIEKFSIGRGYHMEPVKVTIGKEATPKEILKKAAGASYKEGMFSRFKGLEDPELKQDNITVPAYISEKLGGPTTAKAIEYAKNQSSWDTILGEDDYAKYSKWVCMINNKVVKSDAYAEPTLDKKVNVKAGDVIRFQFSIAEGQDIDGYKIWEPETKLIDISNKDALTKLMAEVNATEAKKNPVVKAAYDDAVKVLANAVTPQKDVDAAEAKLRLAVENPQPEGKEVIVAIEKFSIGRGYHMEPVKVTIGKEATPKEILKKAAGASYKEGMFSRFKGLEDPELKQDNITVPAYISEKLGGPTTAKAIEYAKNQSSWDTILGEDDYAKYSKWVCMINNKVVKSDAYAEPTLDKKVNVKAGDVIRFQFSIAEGQDIDGYKIWEPETKLIDISNKDALTKLMAEVNATEAKKNPVVKAAYDDAVKVLANAVTPQKDVDAAEAKLRLAVENPQALEDQMAADNVIKQIDAIGEVTLESKAAIEAARKAYDTLTEPQKALVTNLDKLTKAEAELNDLLTKPAGYAYISVDKATLGQGYLVEPVKVPFFAGENAAQVLNRALEMNGFKLDYTGSLEDSFYMSAITNAGGNLKAEFPAYLQNYIKENKVAVSNPRDGESLGEFDYTSYSGWVFKYDNIHSPVGASGVECKDGMTFRWAFTVCGLGSDCWDTGWGNPIVPYAVNKDALIKKVADFKVRADYEELMKTKTMKDAYAAILKVGTDNEIDQVAIDQAIADFERAIKFELMYIEEAAEVDAKIAAIGEVTLESESAITDARIAYATLSEGAQARVTKLADLEAAEKKLADLKTAEDKKAAAAVDAKIDAIGTVTLGSKAAIDEARAAYDALNAAQQKHVTKLPALEEAEKKYAELKAEADKLAADKKAAAEVDAKIDAIGDVTLDSKAAIDEARAAYDALTADQQKHVTKLPALEEAEKKYAELKAEADKLAADKKAAAEVDAKIDAIGDVTLDSKAAIDEARAAYDALTADQQKHVTKLPALEAAEKKYAELKAEADKLAADKKAAAEVDAKIDAIGDVTLDSKAAIDEARAAYDALTADQQKHVTKLPALEAAEKKYAELKAEADKPAAKPEEDKTPSTGDENAVLLYGLAMLAAAGTAYAARRKYNR